MEMTSSTRRRAAALALAVLAPAVASNAGAQDAKARAQQLFQEGVAAVDKGDSAAGCAQLRESLELFAVANTLFNVAQCDEREGKLGTALAHWQRGLALIDAKDKRVAMAKDHIGSLDGKVPRVRVVVPLGQAGTLVFLDGQELAASALQAPLPLDPGKHAFVFVTPGRQDRRHEVVLAPGERTEVVATVGSPAPAVVVPPGPGTPPPPSAAPSASAAPPPPPPPASGSGLRTGGFVTLGIGAAALIAAGVTGAMVLGRRADANAACPEVGGVHTCDSKYADQLASDKGLVIGNTVAWGVGIAGVGVGAVLLILSTRSHGKPSAVTVAPLVVAGGGGLSLVGGL
jgi:hypothetical protein